MSSETPRNSAIENKDADYREKIIMKIKSKTGRVPDLSEIEDTIQRWVGKMDSKDEANEINEDIGEDIPAIAFWIPSEAKKPIRYGLWSLDDLRTLKKSEQPPHDPFDRAKWIARSAKGSGQSPINIDTKNVKRCWLRPVKVEGLFDEGRDCFMDNNGNTMRIFMYSPAYLSEGPLFGRYKFDHVHFHWSENPHTGTEHAINGKRYAMEAHFVFKAESCKGYKSVIRTAQCRTLCVVGLLFKEVKDAPWYQTFSYSSSVIEPDKKVIIGGNCLKEFKPAFATSEYYNYAGSISIPPYTENVEWIVLQQIMPIQKKQVDNLRALKGHDNKKIKNVRELQEVGFRNVISAISRPGQQFCTEKDIEECVCDF